MRFIPEIINEFERSAQLEICASTKDVQRYLDGHMFWLPRFVLCSLELQEEIKTGIVNAVDGMYVDSDLLMKYANLARFLLAQLHLDSLIGKKSPKAIWTALKKLPTGSKAYDHVYKNAIERIEGQVVDAEELGKQVLL